MINKNIKPGRRYQHYWNKKTYIFMNAALHTETEEILINYIGDEGDHFVRPFDMFFGKEVDAEGKLVDRFTDMGMAINPYLYIK